MAQSRRQEEHGGAAFYLPQRLVVQLGITEDAPEGGVVQMEPGWYTNENLDPRVLENPVVRAMMPKDGQEGARNQAQAAMSKRMYEGQATQADMDKLLQEQAAERTKEQEAAAEEWAGRAQEAADHGRPFMELHPDPAVNFARFLTAPGPQYVAAGGMQSKIEPPVNAPAITPTTVRPTVQRPGQTEHRPD